MDRLDIKTISVVIILMQLLFAIGFAVAAINDKHRYMRKVTFGIAMNTVGMILLLAFIYNRVIGVFIGNSMLLFGYIFYIRGVFELLKIKTNTKELYIFTTGHVILYLALIFWLNNIILVVLGFSIECAGLALCFGVKIFKVFTVKKYLVLLMVSISSIVTSMIHLLRGALAVFADVSQMEAYTYLLKEILLLGIASNTILYLSIVIISIKLSLEKLIETNKSLEELATIDFLTKAHNTRSIINNFKIELENVRKNNKVMTIGIIDIDYFKKINDNFGHLIGDEVLREISKIFQENLSTTDIFGRYGGEEFLVILPETDLDEGLKRVNEIQKIIKNYYWKYNDLTITFSAGLIEVNSKNKRHRLRELLEKADSLLYEAKNNGRDRIESSNGEDRQLKLISI